VTYDEKFKRLIIDAICGVGFPSVLIAQECERVGMATVRLGHDQTYGEVQNIWYWNRKALWAVSIDDLQDLYEGLCEQREKNMEPTEPLDEVPSIIVTQ
jgi:hypothetical protein